MEYWSRLVSASPPPTPYAPRPRTREWGVFAELHRARSTKTNLLLVGPEHVLGKLVTFLVPTLQPDATVRCREGKLRLPPMSAQVDALVVHDVDALSAEEQRRLLDWLDSDRSGTQVISTASVPLLPLVEIGVFNDVLYYRLNMVYIDVSG